MPSLRTLSLAVVLVAGAARADEFFGWSADGSWYAWQTVSGPNDFVELYFCQSDEAVAPSWPESLEPLERSGRPPCVKLTDPNRAPLGWKQQLKLPKPSLQGPTGARIGELVTDGDGEGFQVDTKKGTHLCPASGLTERSRLTVAWFHPSGRLVAASIDGKVVHCETPLSPAPPGASEKKRPEKTPKKRKR